MTIARRCETRRKALQHMARVHSILAQDAFGEDRAGAVAGAEKQDVEGLARHAAGPCPQQGASAASSGLGAQHAPCGASGVQQAPDVVRIDPRSTLSP
jgi:hypothetical protein